MKRTPLKRGTKGLKAYSQKVKEQKGIKQESASEIFMFFAKIWYSLPLGEARCESCGRKLWEPMKSYYFDHLIEKSKRPDLALERDNIFLCCLECHALKTDGHPTEKHKEAIEKAKEKFGLN